MFQLVIAVMAVGLCAALLLFGIHGVSPGAATRHSVAVIVQSGIRTLEIAATSYRTANGGLPLAPTDGGPPDALVPAYASLPMAPRGMAWSYGSTAPGHSLWICLSGPAVDAAQWTGLEAVQRGLPAGRAALDSLCRPPVAADGGTSPEPPAAFPAGAALTVQVF